MLIVFLHLLKSNVKCYLFYFININLYSDFYLIIFILYNPWLFGYVILWLFFYFIYLLFSIHCLEALSKLTRLLYWADNAAHKWFKSWNKYTCKWLPHCKEVLVFASLLAVGCTQICLWSQNWQNMAPVQTYHSPLRHHTHTHTWACLKPPSVFATWGNMSTTLVSLTSLFDK